MQSNNTGKREYECLQSETPERSRCHKEGPHADSRDAEAENSETES